MWIRIPYYSTDLFSLSTWNDRSLPTVMNKCIDFLRKRLNSSQGSWGSICKTWTACLGNCITSKPWMRSSSPTRKLIKAWLATCDEFIIKHKKPDQEQLHDPARAIGLRAQASDWTVLGSYIASMLIHEQWLATNAAGMGTTLSDRCESLYSWEQAETWTMIEWVLPFN